MLRLSVEAQCQGHFCEGPRAYEQKFIERCNSFKAFPGFPAFERFAQQCIDYHCADNYDGTTARFYISFMMDMTPARFEKWLKRDFAKRLWSELGDVLIDESGELIDVDWVVPSGIEGQTTIFARGTHREEIWHWFEETFDVSVAKDLMCLEEET